MTSSMRAAVAAFCLLFLALPAHAAEAVNINSAGAERLTSLDGVGPVLAERIVEHREANGEFESVAGLKAVKGIGSQTVKDLKGQLRVE